MDRLKDYYSILGVPETASSDEIKRAFRMKAKEYHPDVNPGDKEAEQMFKETNEAYGILSDPEKRMEYDNIRKGAFSPGGMGGFSDFDLYQTFGRSDGSFNFQDLFVSPRGQGTRSRGRDIHMTVNLSFEEAVKGTDREIRFSREVECASCGGSKLDQSKKMICSTCGGKGIRAQPEGFFNLNQACPSCKGGGSTGPSCSSCAGRGRAQVSEDIKVKIPAGTDTGTRVRVSGKGEGGTSGGPMGDLILNAQVSPHQYFRREGKNIHLEIPLNISEAILGGNIDIPTIDGTVSLKVPPGTGSGKKFRLRGKGVYGSKSGRGDQYVTVKVSVPSHVDDELRKLVKEISKWEDNTIRKRFD
jgi:molecular chaperone DnaJ